MVDPILFMLTLVLFMSEYCSFAGAQGIGVSYLHPQQGTTNIPPADKTIELLMSHNIHRINLYRPDHAILHGLRNKGIKVILGVPDEDIPSIASSPRFAKVWVKKNVEWYASDIDFRCISVGNSQALRQETTKNLVFPAMQSLQRTLEFFNLSIPVTTALQTNILRTSFPPSAGSFYDEELNLMTAILCFLSTNRYPILYSVNNYYRYESDPDYGIGTVPLDFGLLNSSEFEIHDIKSNLHYTNMLDAVVDSVYTASQKLADSVEIIVIEAGWPVLLSNLYPPGDETVPNAQTFYNNLIVRMRSNQGTPMWPGRGLECYMYELYRNDSIYGTSLYDRYGMFFTNLTETYPLNF